MHVVCVIYNKKATVPKICSELKTIANAHYIQRPRPVVNQIHKLNLARTTPPVNEISQIKFSSRHGLEMNCRTGHRARVARFFLHKNIPNYLHITNGPENIPNGQNIYQTARKYTKWP
jgi:hypothetical protein